MKRLSGYFLIVISAMLIFYGCAPLIKSNVLGVPRTPKPVTHNIIIYNQGDLLPKHSIIGNIDIGDTGFSVECDYDTIFNIAKERARAIGGDAIYITKLNKPDIWSTCYRLSAQVLTVEEPAYTDSKPTPQNLTKEDIAAIVQAAVKGATEEQKKEAKNRPTMQSDIGKPVFDTADRIMGENDLAVIIGIEGYQGIPKSDYSYDDAKLVGDYAKALGFKPRNIELLLDERATKSAIEKIIKTWLPNKAKPDSRVFIYYSGHGAPEPRTGDAYLVPFDGDPNYLEDTGYSLKRLYEKLGRLQVAEVTVVLDSCFSGAGGRSVLAKGARPLVMMADVSVISSNMAVLSATQGTQISTSSPEKGHGIFTYYFLKALKDGKKNILEIYEYIKPLVEDEAKQLNVQQSPSISPDVEMVRQAHHDKGRFELRK